MFLLHQMLMAGCVLPAPPSCIAGRCSLCSHWSVLLSCLVFAFSLVSLQVILVRLETSPEDVGGMHAAQGILTARGGMTSHAAVVARGWGKPCVCGIDKLEVDYAARTATLGGQLINEGDYVSVNGTSGEVLLGRQPVQAPEMSGERPGGAWGC